VAVNDDFGTESGGSFSDDDQPENQYTAAPQPPHERPWRHPSEIGFAAASIQALTPIDIGRRGRGLVGFSCVAGAILISGLLLVLTPRSGRQSTADIVALTNADLHVAEVDSNLSTSEAMGILLFDDQILVTTAAALGDFETVTVQLPDRSMSKANLVHVFPNSGIAVLQIEQQFDRATLLKTLTRTSDIKYSKAFTPGQVVTVLLEQPKRLVVDETSGQSMITLRSSDRAEMDIWAYAEGAPVVDQSGRLIGLCTHSDAALGFIPISSIEKQISTLSDDVDIFSLQPTP
jgi:hypothetical protein